MGDSTKYESMNQIEYQCVSTLKETKNNFWFSSKIRESSARPMYRMSQVKADLFSYMTLYINAP